MRDYELSKVKHIIPAETGLVLGTSFGSPTHKGSSTLVFEDYLPRIIGWGVREDEEERGTVITELNGWVKQSSGDYVVGVFNGKDDPTIPERFREFKVRKQEEHERAIAHAVGKRLLGEAAA